MYLQPRCLQQLTLGLIFDYLLEISIVDVHVRFSYHTNGYSKNKFT